MIQSENYLINLTEILGAVVELKAIWAPNTYYVSYNANGGTGFMSNSTHTYDD